MRVFWWKDCGDIRRFEVYLYAVDRNLFNKRKVNLAHFMLAFVNAVGTANLG